MPGYLSTACRIGTHATCTDAERPAAPAGVPVVYEVCTCSCHRDASPHLTRKEAPRCGGTKG